MVQKNNIYLKYNYAKVFTVNFNQFNATLPKKKEFF